MAIRALPKRGKVDDPSRMIEKETAGAPLIEIRIETAGYVPAEVAGQILEEVARSFERHARTGGRRDVRLGIKRVDIGSLIVQLAVLGSARTIRGEWAMKGFVEATAHLLLVAQGLAAGTVKRSDARMLDVLRAPVSDGVADRVLVVDLDTGIEAIVDIKTVDRLDEFGARTRARVLPKRKPAAIESPEQAPTRRELVGDVGTVLDVKGRWYVRLEGENGVLNPLEPAPGIRVEDDVLYEFDGSWEGRSYVARKAVRIG